MTPQNIAIVMAPNLLWSPETGDADYVSKVNSTASVNTIVEALVSDWTYFFGDDFTMNDFYVTINRKELLGGFPINACDDVMTKSLSSVPSAANCPNYQPNPSCANLSINSYQTHSRSSSHDTSLILLESHFANQMTGGSTDSLTKRSQSNSSLSDSSPPHQSSPKLPIRRKNTKKAAPTPPDNRAHRASEHYGSISKGSHQTSSETMQAMKERFMNSAPSQDDAKSSSNRFLNNETKAQSNTTVFKPPSTPTSLKQCSGSIENLSASKPDKPPRPAMPILDSQTLSRSSYKSKGSDNRHNRPIALPRNIMNVARSTENLSTTSPVKTSPRGTPNDEEIVQLRDRSHESNRNDKPAIPERPTSLMKSNLRSVFDKFESHQPILPESAGIKKTQSFRMSSSPAGNVIGSITGRSLTTLERTHIYNVDKKQVEIIDVDQQNNGNGNHDDGSSNGKNSSSDKENSDKEKDIEKPEKKTEKMNPTNCKVETTEKSNEPKETNEPNGEQSESIDDNNLTLSTSTTNTGHESLIPPQSPRCFEPKMIKRPQYTPPPPPNATIDQGSSEQSPIPKSDATATAAATSDFTKL